LVLIFPIQNFLSPVAAGWAAIAGRQLSGHYSEPMEQQPENGVALAH
jgi:hypothetical protein